VVLHIASKECKTQNVEDVIFLAAQNTIDSIHIVSSKLDSASHTTTLAWHRVICERDIQQNRVVCKPTELFRPMGLLDWWSEFLFR